MSTRSGAALTLVFALHVAACHRTPGPTVTPDLRSGEAAIQLRRDIDELLAAPPLSRGTAAVLVRSLARGDTLYSTNAQRLLMPASGIKLVTLAVAADQLGWNYSYETHLFAEGTVDFGRLDGDLRVVGGGDPSIDDWDGFAGELFRGWAEQLKRLGVAVVGGRIIGDDNLFDDEPLGAGWAWDDLSASYATGVGALQFNQNTARLTMHPGLQVGDPVEVTIAPDGSGLDLVNRLKTSATDRPPVVTIYRLPGSTTLEVRGTVPMAGGPVFRNVSVDNATSYFATALRGALIANGVEVRGPAVDIDAISGPLAPEHASLVLVHRSPPLSALAATMMKNSQNLYAETLLKSLGVSSGIGAVDSGRGVVSSVLESWGIPSGSVVLVDGSGLSRYNLITADALVTVLARVYTDDRLRAPFEATLPIAGKDGTLARRLAGTAAEGVVSAKTGAFTNARSLSGYVHTAGGETLAFCIIANNFGTSAETVERVIDAIVVKLAAFGRRR